MDALIGVVTELRLSETNESDGHRNHMVTFHKKRAGALETSRGKHFQEGARGGTRGWEGGGGYFCAQIETMTHILEAKFIQT